MKQFHPLVVAAKSEETRDSVRIALEVPAALREEFAFLPGQHLPVQIERDGKHIRRTYSICSGPGEWPLQIGVRVQPGGTFSGYAANELAVGDRLDVMPPTGRFHLAGEEAAGKFLVAFAAGSGITPILSIAKAVLRRDDGSRFALFYGNRRQSSTMFIEDLFALKNEFPKRFQAHFVFSQEEQEFDIAAGRLDAARVAELLACFCKGQEVAAAFVCGPDTMIKDVTGALVEAGIAPECIHSERFGVPRRGVPRPPQEIAAAPDMATVTVIMDGHRKTFEMPRASESIVDAAAEHGIELPYSCKGGVCATCRTHLSKGEVDMATNYGLEPWEVEQGFVLACQSRPLSDEVLLDYDKT